MTTLSLALSIASLLTSQVPAEGPPSTSAASTASAGSTTSSAIGGFVAPAVMPSGALSVYGYVGAPEIGGGFRQGIAGVELEARARLDYFRIAFGAEALIRFLVFEKDKVQVAPRLGLGFVANTGAIGIDTDNFSAISLRFLPGLIATYAASETVTAFALVDLPFDLGLSPAGTNRFHILGGGGAEIALDEEVSAGLTFQAGIERYKAPGRLDTWRFAWQTMLGVGFRLF